ncbi:hypothetical protein GDO81_023030 [Engystomops pustulosus]|uniref:Uncharacterized protein n=1 Tax=Engystomops pustulosus TaxID=76066 RepID=A0AAV6YT07_ENGPU|nr:hypothetical protein GDO81_023030 [Engystomops pustulosus]
MPVVLPMLPDQDMLHNIEQLPPPPHTHTHESPNSMPNIMGSMFPPIGNHLANLTKRQLCHYPLVIDMSFVIVIGFSIFFVFEELSFVHALLFCNVRCLNTPQKKVTVDLLTGTFRKHFEHNYAPSFPKRFPFYLHGTYSKASRGTSNLISANQHGERKRTGPYIHT